MNIDDEYTNEELKNEIIEKNFPDCKDKFFQVNYIYKHPTNNKKIAFVELEPVLFNKIMTEKKVCVRWTRCTVYEDLDRRFCHKCSNLGHNKNKCTQNKNTCPKCMGEHSKESCTNNSVLKCVNCTQANLKSKGKIKRDTNHCANDFKKCETYKMRIQHLKSQINYTADFIN